MATLSADTPGNPPGILLADIWQASVLQPFAAVVDMEDPQRPILAASKGFSHATVSLTPDLYLADANPLIFPADELLSKLVQIPQGAPTYHAIFLPEICYPPLGLRWPTDIGIEAFMKSLELLGRAYKPFLLTIDALQPILEFWFSNVNTYPSEYVVPTCSCTSLATTAFPALTDGIYPPTIIDHLSADGHALRPSLATPLRPSPYHHNWARFATFLYFLAARH
jgi:hypothetical protein